MINSKNLELSLMSGFKSKENGFTWKAFSSDHLKSKKCLSMNTQDLKVLILSSPL